MILEVNTVEGSLTQGGLPLTRAMGTITLRAAGTAAGSGVESRLLPLQVLEPPTELQGGCCFTVGPMLLSSS